MNRRQYLTTATAGGLGLFAGCVFWPGEPGRPADRRTDEHWTITKSPSRMTDLGAWRRSLLKPDEGCCNDHFGQAVSLDGETALVGTPFDDEIGGAAGAAYVFTTRDGGWSKSAKLVPEDDFEEERDYKDDLNLSFGSAVALDGDVAVVGAPAEDESSEEEPDVQERATLRGAAYVFERSGSRWTQRQKLTALADQQYSYFGETLSLDENTLLVGSPRREVKGFHGWDRYAGAVHVFDRQNGRFVEVTTISASEIRPWAFFGEAVSLDGTRALISEKGAAYVYERANDQWTERAKLTVGEPQTNFGHSACLSGENAIIGQPLGANEDGVTSGAAYVYVRDPDSGPHAPTWSQQAKLTPSEMRGGISGMGFGTAVAIEGDVAVVGANWSQQVEEFPGVAYVFTREDGSWTERARLEGRQKWNPAENRNMFGSSISMDGRTAIVGAHSGYTNGAVYVFSWDVPADGES